MADQCIRRQLQAVAELELQLTQHVSRITSPPGGPGSPTGVFACLQRVTLVSKGRLMYHGPINDMVPWFDSLGYNDFDPAKHGVPSDWALDLVAIGFTKPLAYYGMLSATAVAMRVQKQVTCRVL